MAFTNTPNEGVPYYKAPEPRVPEPDNTAAKIISAGTASGISAFVNMALGAQRAQLQQQEMMQQADLQAQRLEYQDKWQEQDHEVAKLQLKSLDAYRRGTAGNDYGNPKWRAQQAAELKAKNAELAEQRQASVDAATLKGMKEFQDRHLHDETRWVTEPVAQLERYQDWMGRWSGAVDSDQLTKTAEDLTARAAKLTIPIRWGAQYVEPMVNQDGKRVEGHYAGGDLKQMPLLDFVQQWHNKPEIRDQLKLAVAGGGNTHIIDQIEAPTPEVRKQTTFLGIPMGKKEVVTPGDPGRILHKIEFNPDVQGIMNAATTANLQRGENQVPPELQRPLQKQQTLGGGGGAGIGQTAEWARAIEWANSNPSDPRSQQILSAAGR